MGAGGSGAGGPGPGKRAGSDELDRSLRSAELPDRVTCPFCGGRETEQFSAFGSAVSTSQYYCRRCRTVFEHFKRGGRRAGEGAEPDAAGTEGGEAVVEGEEAVAERNTEGARGRSGRPKEEDPMAERVKHADDVPADDVGAGSGTRRQVLIGPDEAPRFALRRFVMEPGGGMPRHTNRVEHEQYVLRGRATIGIGEEEYTVTKDDVVYIPAGVPHWYRAEGDEPFEFLCAVPNEPDEIRILEDRP